MFESFDVYIRVFQELFWMLFSDFIRSGSFVFSIYNRILEHVDHEILHSLLVVGS